MANYLDMLIAIAPQDNEHPLYGTEDKQMETAVAALIKQPSQTTARMYDAKYVRHNDYLICCGRNNLIFFCDSPEPKLQK